MAEAGCQAKAATLLSAAGLEAWRAGAQALERARVPEGAIASFLDAVPDAASVAGEAMIKPAADTAAYLAAVPDVADCAEPFLAALPAMARRVENPVALMTWFGLVKRMSQNVRPGLKALIATAPHLLERISIGGLSSWVDFGISTYRNQGPAAALYFSLRTADSQAALQRERHGTLLVDRERELKLILRSFWGLAVELRPFSMLFDVLRSPRPHLDKLGFHLPDVLDDAGGVAAIDRYRAMVAHMAAHRTWSTPYTADNYSQLQHIFIEAFEDARVEHLAIARYPGLRRLFLAQHPIPRGPVPEGMNSIRFEAARLSRALLDPAFPADGVLAEFAARFRAADLGDPQTSARLGVDYLARIRKPDFREPKVWFDDTLVPYRDDNRYLWRFLEDTDSKDDFHSDHGTAEPPPDDGLMLPTHHPEWDYQAQDYRPDWSTVYEAFPPSGEAARIDALLDRHAITAKRLKRVIDRLKPQNRKRLRRMKEGDDLDLDQAITATIDRRAGIEPDPRVYQSHMPDGRDIAVLLLLDLSHSLNDRVGDTRLLDLAQEATALLAWAVEQLGDRFAIAGFASKSRHLVRYERFKDFAEPWAAPAKARLAGMEAGLATRMGAALRHAGDHLAARREDKKLLLLLSDGEPADIDVDDDDYLKWDTHAAVGELRGKGVHTFCMTLDRKADAYVADIFGPGGFTVVDKVEALPEKLTRLFLSLTK